MCFLNDSNPSQVNNEDKTSELSMNQDKVSDDNFYFAMYLIEFLEYGNKMNNLAGIYLLTRQAACKNLK